jgi:hypothetical protein
METGIIGGFLPESITARVFADGVPLEGAWASITFGMRRKNPHGILAGPTDANGATTVSRDKIERDVRRTIETSPMDYVTLNEWDGSIVVNAMGRELVERVFKAVEVWGSLGTLETEGNFQSLKAYRVNLETIAGALLSVEAHCKPVESADISTVDAPA